MLANISGELSFLFGPLYYQHFRSLSLYPSGFWMIDITIISDANLLKEIHVSVQRVIQLCLKWPLFKRHLTLLCRNHKTEDIMKCDICEEKPAKFLCKNCSGHLCEKCKSEHAKTKMFKKHEVVPWETNEDLVSILHCTDHTKKKLECFCDRCEKPICTECMLLFHNGHCIKTLSDGYREIKDKTLKQTEKIENEILPKYAEVLAKESNKRSALTKRSAEIEQTIHRHTQSLIEMIKKVSAQTVQNLKEEEKKGLQEISSFQESVSKKINALEQKSKTLHAEVKGNPEVLFFSSRRKDELEQYQVLPVPPASHYSLDGFSPGNLSLRVIENGFGKVQKLKRSDENPQANVFVS